MDTDVNTNAICIEIGKRIRALRKEQGLTQEAFASMVRIDRSYMVTIEHGRRKMTINTLARVCAGLGITLSELFDGIA